jgi:hypothetical protein
MSDDEIRRHLEALAPSTDDIDVETALTRTRAVARVRSRRRRVALRAAPLAVAAATVAIVLLATIGPLNGSDRSPAHRPSPSASGGNAWFRHVSGSSGSVDLASVWVVRLTDPNNGTFDVRPGDRFGVGTFRYDGSRGGWIVDVLGRYCNQQSGVYRVVKSGQSLAFNVVTDGCPLRRDVLDNTVFEPLTSPDQLIG